MSLRSLSTRADLMTLRPGFATLAADTSGNPVVWRNHHECDHGDPDGMVMEYWTNDWSCQCDDKCPVCGASVSPTESTWIGPDNRVDRLLWENLPESL